MTVREAGLEQLGNARKIVTASTTTTLIADSATRDEIEIRVAQLKKELSETDSVYDTEKLSERIAKLAGGVAVIKVGGFTEAEIEDRKLRIEDAKNATFAAVEEGIVPGGGTALVHLSEFLTDFRTTLTSDEERMGCDIVYKGLRAPCRQIAYNAGLEGDVVVEMLLGKEFNYGYNAMDDTYLDLVSAGVIDPAKVTRSGLQNAASIAGILLTTQAVMTEIPKINMDEVGLGKGGLPTGLTM